MGQIGYASGFAQQVSYGPGNVDVIIPWPAGGFAQYWYDMRARQWNGPAVVSGDFRAPVTSLSWYEGDYQTHDNGDHYNYEMVTGEGARAVHWWRENKAPFRWTRQQGLPRIVAQVVLGRTHKASVTEYLGLLDERTFHQDMSIYATLPGVGIAQWTRAHLPLTWSGQEMAPWWSAGDDVREVTEGSPFYFGVKYARITEPFSGIAWALGTVASLAGDVLFGPPWDTSTASDLDFAQFCYDGQWITVGVRTDGTLLAFEQHAKRQQIATGLRGRPAIVQTDRGRKQPVFGTSTPGQYEAFAPGRDGGIRHFWRSNDGPDMAWNDAGVVGTELYDEVSVVQLADDFAPDGDETSPLWLFARIDGEPWVDHFVQRHTEAGFHWEPMPGLGDPNRSEVWEVTCVTTQRLPNGARRIVGLGGEHLGLPWRLSKAEAIADIQSRRRRFRTRAPDGRTAWINVADYPNTPAAYLITSCDGIKENNLTDLLQCAVIPPPPPPTMPFLVEGRIRAKWERLGGFEVMGLPTGPEHDIAGGRRQDFVGGQIAYSPRQGQEMMVWARRSGDDVEFAWGPTDPFNYDLFIVRWSQTNGMPVAPDQQEDVAGGPRTFGRFRRPLPLAQIGSDGHHAGWSFIVEGADSGGVLSGVDAKQGWTVPLGLRL